VSLSEGEILDIGSTCLTDPKSVEAEEHGQSGMALIETLGREEESAELPAIQSPPFGRVDLGAPYVLGRVGVHPSVDESEPVEAADG
jgi:hypothetical protein